MRALPLSADALSQERQALIERHDGEQAGLLLCAALTDWMDAIVSAAFEEARGGQPLAAPLAVLAVGGYGRGELSPGSDVDLLFLTPEPEAVAPVVRGCLERLWALGLQLGFATREVEGCLALARTDLHTATGLTTARWVAGDALLRTLNQAVEAFFVGAALSETLTALSDSMVARHERYGDSVYLLEPNVKLSPGGLRDLGVLEWAARLTRGVGLTGLAQAGLSSVRAEAEIGEARRFLLKVRNLLHRVAPFGGDRLTFEHQEAVAAKLGFGQGASAVEAFMAAYYGHAAVIKRRSRLILERCRPPTPTLKPAPEVAPPFAVQDGALTVEPLERLVEPALMMGLFVAASDLGLPLHGLARDRIADTAERLREHRAEPAVVDALFTVLCAAQDPHDLLGELHETGVLSALLPEFGAIAHRTHHDQYHVYTVDVHTLHAVRRLKALARGELTGEPLLTQVFGRIQERRALFLATLLHDVGKALGHGHARRGARLVPAIARRLKLTREEARLVEWLVRDHLLMAHLSQRRDLSDEGLVRQFARQVGSEEALSLLFVLTWADASTTGPQAWTDWKAALAAELYARAAQRLRRGLDLYEDPERTVARRRRAVTRWLDRHGDPRAADVNGPVDRFFDSLPTDYFRRTRGRDIARHLDLLGRLSKARPVALAVVPRPKRGYTAVHVAGLGRPGLLSALTGVLAAFDLDVLSADLHLTAEGRALYVLRVRDSMGGALGPEDERFSRIEEALLAVVRGEREVATLLAARRRGRFAWPEGPRIATRVEVDQQAAAGLTVLELRARDRIGLLHTVVKTLESLKAQVRLARIGTESDAVHDTFYLEHETGGPIPDAEVSELVARVTEAVSAV